MIGRKNIDRILAVGLIGAAVWLVLLGRLFMVQVLYADDYREKADYQHQKTREILAVRGSIYDCNNTLLAKNTIAYDIWTRPGMIRNIEEVDSAFSATLGFPQDSIARLLRGKKANRFVFLAREVELSKAELLFELERDSLVFDEVRDRVYPLGKTASQIVGFVDPDGRGLEGIEYGHDRELAGTKGEVIVLSDASGRDYQVFQYGGKQAIPGKNIHLTIDSRLQQIVESELAIGVTELCEATGGTALFMRPATGEILAMACYPAFDLNDYSKSEAMDRKMKAITDIYEPGSTFKIVAFSALIENNAVALSETIDCEMGSWFFCNDSIHDAEPHGNMMARSVLIHSSNIGTIKLAQRMPKDSLYAYARAFGFGNPTGVDLEGEVGGILHKPQNWSARSIGAFPMGHEVAVTSIQVAAAYGAIANRGILVQPRLVSQITDADGNIIDLSEAVQVRRVISEATAETLCTLLEGVVDSGTATKAAIQGIAIAGKTGTAQKVKENGRGYYERRFVSSFVGFAPVDNPQIVGIVVIDDPHKFPHWGGWTAAPIWRNIVSKAFATGVLSIGPKERDTLSERTLPDYVAVPDVRRMRTSQAIEVLKYRELIPDTVGEGYVITQSPQPGRMVPRNTRVILAIKPGLPVERNRVEIPDVIGMPLRDAAMEFAQSNIDFVVIGNGVVSLQDPPAGSMIEREGVCLLTCKIQSY